MIQTIDFAPLDGITKIVFRQVWSQFFGGVDRYFIPFFSPTPHHLMTPRDLREVDYIHNANLPSVPQVMTKNADDFLWACDVLKDMGFYQSAVDAVDKAVRAGMTEVAASAAAAGNSSPKSATARAPKNAPDTAQRVSRLVTGAIKESEPK